MHLAQHYRFQARGLAADELAMHNAVVAAQVRSLLDRGLFPFVSLIPGCGNRSLFYPLLSGQRTRQAGEPQLAQTWMVLAELWRASQAAIVPAADPAVAEPEAPAAAMSVPVGKAMAALSPGLIILS